ncbi:hypothetical protein [Halorubrum saccharovorum]|uniref:hypothetical protein n=1 Tax=Halorubrum saccharovorum TaxID=2248 RepID=UPI0004DAB245|nr:hypothetical protein [Halorubrum saccharovorum]
MSTATRSPPARVSALRTLSLVLAFTAAVGLIFGTAGFSAMEADRGLDVNVTDDESAYLGYKVTDETETINNSTTVTAEAEYHNQFSGELTLDVRVEVNGEHRKNESATLGQGEATRIEVTESCSAGETVDFSFVATGNGSGVNVSLERTHSVPCE